MPFKPLNLFLCLFPLPTHLQALKKAFSCCLFVACFITSFIMCFPLLLLAFRCLGVRLSVSK